MFFTCQITEGVIFEYIYLLLLSKQIGCRLPSVFCELTKAFPQLHEVFCILQKHFRSCTNGSANCKSATAAALMVLQFAKGLPQLHEWFRKLQKHYRSCTNGFANCRSASATARMVLCRHKSRSTTTISSIVFIKSISVTALICLVVSRVARFEELVLKQTSYKQSKLIFFYDLSHSITNIKFCSPPAQNVCNNYSNHYQFSGS